MKANDQPQQIYDFLKRNAKVEYCDDCLEKNTGINRHTVNTIASTLGLFKKEFRRRETTCPQRCSDRDKLVTQAN